MTEYNVHDHRIIATHRIISRDLNDHDTLFGGRLLEIADAEPAVLVSRLALRSLATASFDDVQFRHPFTLLDSLTLTATLTGLGNRSAEVFVKVIGQNLRSGERFLGYTSFNTYVVTDKDFTFPDFTLIGETEEEKYLISTYEERQAKRKAAHKEQRDNFLPHITLNS